MTRYIDFNAMQKLVRRVGADTFITQLAGYIRADYLRWSEFEKSARVANHNDVGVIELMPISDRSLYAFKYVNGHPQNTLLKLPTVMAFGVLADMATGYPQLLSELTLVTALRTAATSALVARELARPDARCMAVIGNGAQSEFQILAFKAMLGIDRVRIYDTDRAASEKLLRNLGRIDGLEISIAASARAAVSGADIVTTITADKHYATILTPDMVEPGMHINAVGGDCPGKTELHADILRGARVIVEFEEQTRVEGDIQQMPADFPVTELWRVLAGEQPGREHAGQVTVFDSVGFALEDFSALRYVHDLAAAHDIGVATELVPTPADPKDLFACLGEARRGAAESASAPGAVLA
ncbi:MULTISPECIES: ornithine cyclodeaminase [unclassified Janthinobacterium]|uniref:ornithine cyclodeaminase n=1 Tax=unclassified Janthinobacterium TaxID=2610881 RepID=UPI00034D2A6F|nr:MULTISPECIES: ornithine cyclodeaminase [unclassified Janthinobacterium]MEC5163252.1 ornithine cyclodeaminase [Janthinobacterium sp. CG_S6]